MRSVMKGKTNLNECSNCALYALGHSDDILGNYIHYSLPKHYYFLTTGIYSLKINPFIGNTLGAPLVGQ